MNFILEYLQRSFTKLNIQLINIKYTIMNRNELNANDIERGFEKTCACGCGQTFYTRNQKRKYKNDYHKHFNHYNLKKEKMKNMNLIDKGNYENFIVVEKVYGEGHRTLSPEALQFRGYDPGIAPVIGEVDGKPALLYNNYALIKDGEFLKIIKISKWRK